MATVTAPQSLASHSPLTGERIGSVPTLQPDEVQAVVDDVASVQPFWAQLPLAGGARYMKGAPPAVPRPIDDPARALARAPGEPVHQGLTLGTSPPRAPRGPGARARPPSPR